MFCRRDGCFRGFRFRRLCWGCFAALRGHARSHRFGAEFGQCAIPVGAGMPAKGRKRPPRHALTAPALLQQRQTLPTLQHWQLHPLRNTLQPLSTRV
ncbi:hypothetical protein CMV24_01840 [Pseudomonas plecoglossicida]|uniref:Uncharacterized protein n=1 Tax=Pseudomonas plecoglossicida TaxID=70775 RepID=A0A2A3MBL9_PSEDL|nr:hypothetical protein CMV24_01840 [Pseudomonas plecoglossicida]